MRNKILSFLEKDARLTASEIAVLAGAPEDAVQKEIQQMEAEGIISGYHALIDWDKTDRAYVTALIEIKVTLARGQGFDRIAERIYRYDEVQAVYLMSGGYDLTVIVEGKTLKEVAHFVSDKLASLESVLNTATHFVLKKYKDHNVIMERKNTGDERMVVSP